MDDFTKASNQAAVKIAAAIDLNIKLFIEKIEGSLPSVEDVIQNGHMVMMDDDYEKRFRFFIWKKHNVMAIRFEPDCTILFCHLFPDDWPEALANHIASLP